MYYNYVHVDWCVKENAQSTRDMHIGTLHNHQRMRTCLNDGKQMTKEMLVRWWQTTKPPVQTKPSIKHPLIHSNKRVANAPCTFPNARFNEMQIRIIINSNFIIVVGVWFCSLCSTFSGLCLFFSLTRQRIWILLVYLRERNCRACCANAI